MKLKLYSGVCFDWDRLDMKKRISDYVYLEVKNKYGYYDDRASTIRFIL
jgi:hypothetical protein